MGTIADKLNYLNNTKAQIKNEINKIGGNIIDETTFRDYVSNINNIYDKLPKVEGNGSDITLNDTEEALLSLTPEGYASQGILPSDYMQVEYIESTGEQYINTNYIPNENTRIIAKTTFNIGCLFGTIDNEEIKSIVLAGAKGPNTWAEYARFFSKGGVQIPYNFINTAENTVYEIEMTNSEAKIILNDKSYIANYTRENQNITTPLYIFARNTGAEAISFTQRKLYKFKIYNSNVLVRDYIPCYRKLDGEIGLYDLVNNIFYTNQGTGSFLHGNVIPNPQYPQPIKVVTGEQNVEIKNKNLLKLLNINSTFSGVQVTVNSDKSITLNGTCTSNYAINIITNWSLSLENGKTYTLSGCPDLGGKDTLSLELYSNSPSNQYITDIGSGKSFTLTADRTYRCYIAIKSGKTYNNVTLYPMLEENNEVTSFEPYQSQNYPLPLGNIELFRNYTDSTKIYIDYIFKNEIGSSHYKSNLEEDSWYIYNRNKKVELKNYNYTNSITKRTNTILFLGAVTGKVHSRYYCNILSNYNYRTLIGSDIEGIGDGGGYANRLYISVNKNRLEGYTDELTNSQLNTLLKQFLEDNNAYAWYALSTSTYEKITDTTLISQLENMNNNARSYKGTTIIECSSASEENETLQVSTVALKDLDLLATEESTETLTTNSISNISTNEVTTLNSIEEIESEE